MSIRVWNASRGAGAVAWLLLVGCATGPEVVAARDPTAPFQTSRLDYSFVDEDWAWTLTVPITFTNRGTAAVRLGGCATVLQMAVPSGWHSWSGPPCPQGSGREGADVAPGESVAFSFDWARVHDRARIPPTAPPDPGLYRILIDVYERQVPNPGLIVWQWIGDVDRRRSNEFAVRLSR